MRGETNVCSRVQSLLQESRYVANLCRLSTNTYVCVWADKQTESTNLMISEAHIPAHTWRHTRRHNMHVKYTHTHTHTHTHTYTHTHTHTHTYTHKETKHQIESQFRKVQDTKFRRIIASARPRVVNTVARAVLLLMTGTADVCTHTHTHTHTQTHTNTHKHTYTHKDTKHQIESQLGKFKMQDLGELLLLRAGVVIVWTYANTVARTVLLFMTGTAEDTM